MNIKDYSVKLKDRGLLARNIQFAKWNDWTIVSTFDEKNTQFISESISMGIDQDPEIALAKALTEHVERSLFNRMDHPALQIYQRSDGVAAYPASIKDAKSLVRNNALGEATERFLWSTWWDNADIAHTFKESTAYDCHKLVTGFNLRNIYEIMVKATDSDCDLLILLAETEPGGFITGGAAGLPGEKEKTYARAFGELLRHLLAYDRIRASNKEGLSFYERRLWGFCSGSWGHLVKERLNAEGKEHVELTDLIVDEEIVHEYSDLVLLHRCLFRDQPIFIGGRVERLCI